MTKSDAGVYINRAPKGATQKRQMANQINGENERYNDKYTAMIESKVNDSQGDQTTIFAKVPRSNCSEIRLADLLVQSGQRILNGGMKSFSVQNVAEMKNQSL